MFKQIEGFPENIVALHISGEITKTQFTRISDILKTRIERTGRIRLLLAMRHYASMNSAEAICEDLRFAKVFSDSIDRMAVIGDKAWKRTWIGIFGLFSGIQSEYFDTSEIQTAVNWLMR